MADAMRDALELALSELRRLAKRGYSDDCVIKEVEAALAQQPAQGEAVAWRAGACFFNFEADAHEFVKNTLSSYPVEPLYTTPPAPSVPDGWRDAFIAVCGAWDGCDRFVSANFARLGDAVVEYPVLQGTSNQLAVRRIGRLAYDGKRAAVALREIAAMLAAAPEVKS